MDKFLKKGLTNTKTDAIIKVQKRDKEREEIKMYKVYERIAKNHVVLRMVTDDKVQAENYLSYLLTYYKRAWMKVEE